MPRTTDPFAVYVSGIAVPLASGGLVFIHFALVSETRL
jgi:hypothetical protein